MSIKSKYNVEQQVLRVLIYKRTHIGDPNAEGVFGIEDCMGQVRAREFDAVIGIGGVGAGPRSYGIDRRVNWVGIGPHKQPGPPDHRGPWISFDHFVSVETEDHLLEKWPGLVRHMYKTNRRVVMSDDLPNEILQEVQSILRLAEDKPPSPARSGTQAKVETSTRDKSQGLRFNPCLCHSSHPSGRYGGAP